MSWEVDDRELEAVFALGAQKRYRYFVGRSARHGEVWSLSGPDGWATAEGEAGQPLLPLWPHRRFAEACALEHWADLTPKPIDVDDWVHAWTPKLEEDDLQVAAFPTPDEDGIVVPPARLATDLRTELEQF